ncbi:SPOR domain-containing protein [Lautropia dentalis]|nr:SPOR domain-containing protein [Lautropia dentalis]
MTYTRSHHVWRGPRAQQGGTFLGILLGLMLGAGAAAGIAWYIYQSPLPFITPSTPDKGKVVQSAPEVPSPVPSVDAPQGSTLPDPNQGSSRQQVMPQPDPRNVVQSQGVSTVDVAAGDDTAALDAAAPVAPADAPAADAASAAAAPAARGGFLLQAGSFRRQADADRLKGNLALRGLEARVESAAVGGQTVYRVRIGPYGSLDQVNQIRRELADDGIEAAAVRMR